MQYHADTEHLLSRITVNPNIMLGKPTIRGTRLTVEHILKATVRGLTFGQLHEDFPFLEPEDIQACILYATQLVENERVYSISV
ncbi:MAG: DUF433 domain-containing protein [Saprospiraceae bacterium]|nr:DUF433 domain-containing protein [Saprospiraceae bacterium]